VKAISLGKATELMRTGARLMKMHTNRSPDGMAFYIVPDGYIEPSDAHKIIDRPDVYVFDDVLFPGNPQSWKLGGPHGR
jgi:hypothetical protein